MSFPACLPLISQTVTPTTSSQTQAPWQALRLPTMLLEDKTHHQTWAAVKKLGQKLFTSSQQKWQTSKNYSTNLSICLVFKMYLLIQSSGVTVSVFYQKYFNVRFKTKGCISFNYKLLV